MSGMALMLRAAPAVVDTGGRRAITAAKAADRHPEGAPLPRSSLAEGSGVSQGSELAGEGRGVLQRLELRFAVGVVVGHVRAGVRAGHAPVDEELRDGFGGHRGAPVGVDDVGDAVHTHRLFEHGLGVLACGDGPRHDVAGSDVEHHVQVVVHRGPGRHQLGPPTCRRTGRWSAPPAPAPVRRRSALWAGPVERLLSMVGRCRVHKRGESSADRDRGGRRGDGGSVKGLG